MSEHNQDRLEALDLQRFTEMLPKRRAVIEQAPATPLKKDYAVNQLAQVLHPKKQFLVVDKVVDHFGGDAKSFYLKPDAAAGTSACAYFRAGQYLSISLEIDGAQVSKPYSIRSGPGSAKSDGYILTVKRSPDGFASQKILNEWAVGTKVVASGPEGNFYYEPLRDAAHVIGIAGGSGITPFHSLACAIADGIENCSLTLLYGSRTADTILLKEEFDALANKIKVVHVLSHEERDGYEHGFVTAELIRKYAPLGDYSVFLCGPQAMYDFVDGELPKLNLSARRIRHELFGEYKHPERNPDYPKDAVGKTFQVSVCIRGEKQTISCRADETLLRAMEQAGIHAPSRCRSGDCGFCHSRLVSGQVYLPASVDGRRLADHKFGYIHPCCTFPLSDVEIDVPV